MVHDKDAKEVAGERPEGGAEAQAAGLQGKPDKGDSIEENLEKLAALNLSSGQSLQPRLSTSIIRLVSALAGIGALVLIYFILKLFI